MDIAFFVIGGGVAAYLAAKSRGRSGWWWLAGWVGLVCVLVMPSRKQDPEAPTPETHVRCPECRELVRMDASKCRHCGNRLVPLVLDCGGEVVPVAEVLNRVRDAIRAGDVAAFEEWSARLPDEVSRKAMRDYAALYDRAEMAAMLK